MLSEIGTGKSFARALFSEDFDSTVPLLLTERLFATRAPLKQAAKALADADKCIALSPDFVKGHFRRGVALIALERFQEGAASLSKVLDMDPKNAEAKASLQMAQV